MPIYEYRCGGCDRKYSLFFRSIGAAASPVCPTCGSADAHRLISQFAVGRSADWVNEGMPPMSGMDDVDENDPRSMAKFLRRMGREMGEDAGPDFAEMVDRVEAGEMPEGMGGGAGFDGPEF